MFKFPAFLVILAFLLLSISPGFAVGKKAPLKVKEDTSKIIVKSFDKAALDKFKADKDFDYNGESINKPTLWQIFWRWLWNIIGNLFEKVPYGGTILQYLLIGVSVAFLIYVILK